MEKILVIHERDNVAVALSSLQDGETLPGGLCLRQAVAPGHKLALRDIAAGEPVIKYGHPIGSVLRLIKAGEHVHSHNLRTGLAGPLEYRYNPVSCLELAVEPAVGFPAYRRKGGKVGIRNEVWIINTVGCCNKISERLASLAAGRYRERRIDRVIQFSHPYGCSQLGEDHANTQKILAGLVRHPNAGGVLVLGLGCENNHLEQFRAVVGEKNPERVRWLNAQDVEDEVEAGLMLLDELVAYAETFRRETVPASELVVGLKCGGSDAFSGITANPLVGLFTDRLLAQGGTALLTEVPEMFGAETILMERCGSRELFEQTAALVNGFKDYYARHGQAIYENPSPGNKEGGITTLEEKSLGCILKGGSSPVRGVLAYGDAVGPEQKGLILLEGPGNDMVAVTALAAAGAHLVLFTTGRGTPLGGPVPTVKISSNSELAARKKHWIDFDAGRLFSGTPLPGLEEEFFQFVLEAAAGQRRTRNEEHNYREIGIFKAGVIL
ncbi:MAG: altronate dehydratase family protein [Bacillota bacterium]